MVWVEMRRRSRGAGGPLWRCRRGRRRGAGNVDRPGKRDCPDLYRARSSGEGPCRIQTSLPESGAPIGPDPSRGLPAWPETASLCFRQGHPKQWQYCAPNPRDDMNRPHRNWHANHPAKIPGRPVKGPACLLGRSTSVDQRARSAHANVARTVHSLARSQPRWPQRREDVHHPWRIHRCQRGPKVHRHG